MNAIRTKAKKPKLSASQRAKRRGGIYGHFDQHYFLKGRKGDLVFFIRNNKQCVRPLGDMTALRWWKDPKFENSRGASREFGAACAYSGAIRKGLGKMASEVGGTKLLHNKVVKQVLHSFKGLPGKRGERVLSGGHVASRLQRLAWNKNGQTHLMPFGFSQCVIEPLIWKPKVEFTFMQGMKVPKWATEVRVVFEVLAVGDMVKRKNGRKYAVAKGHRALHGTSRSSSSEWMSVSGAESGERGAKSGMEKLTAKFAKYAKEGGSLSLSLSLSLSTEFEVGVQGLAVGKEGTQGRFVPSGSTALTRLGEGSAALTRLGEGANGIPNSISVRPDLVFPEAVELGMGLVVVTAVEVRALQPNGEVFDQQYVGMECVWAGSVAQSVMEVREEEARNEKVMELVDWMRQQEPVLLYCEESDPPEVHERVARDRLRQADAIELLRLALE